MFNNMYRNRRVLVTGHTGFKGSWLALWLQQLGAEVVGFSRDVPTSPAHFEALGLSMEDRRGDVREQAAVRALIAETRPALVFHMAAQPLVRQSYRDPLDTLASNIMGTCHILEACRNQPDIKGVVCITSDKCYENDESGAHYTETDPMGGHDPYSASKGCAELVVGSYARAFADLPPTVSARAGNVVGGGDWAADRLVPDAARAKAKAETLVIRHPNATRPWQHVLEPLSGYLLLGQKLLEANGDKAKAIEGPWNFGPDPADTLTVEAILQRLQPVMGFSYRAEPKDIALHEAHLLSLNSTKAKTQLGWSPVWGNEEMIAATAAWYKAYAEGRVISAAQIEAYAAQAKAVGLAWAV